MIADCCPNQINTNYGSKCVTKLTVIPTFFFFCKMIIPVIRVHSTYKVLLCIYIFENINKCLIFFNEKKKGTNYFYFDITYIPTL